jgi:hypothetical protein
MADRYEDRVVPFDNDGLFQSEIVQAYRRQASGEGADLDSTPQQPSHGTPTSVPARPNTCARAIERLEILCGSWLQPRHKKDGAKRLPFAVPFPRVFELLAPHLARSGPARSRPLVSTCVTLTTVLSSVVR